MLLCPFHIQFERKRHGSEFSFSTVISKNYFKWSYVLQFLLLLLCPFFLQFDRMSVNSLSTLWLAKFTLNPFYVQFFSNNACSSIFNTVISKNHVKLFFMYFNSCHYCFAHFFSYLTKKTVCQWINLHWIRFTYNFFE